MSNQVPATGLVRVRVLQVNTLMRGEMVHEIKARVMPRDEHTQPMHFTIRDELCSGGPKVGDRLRLTLQLGEVAGVEIMPRGRSATHKDE